MRCYANELVMGNNCQNPGVKDGYCESHWQFLFKGMTNHQRMIEKKHLRGIRQQKIRDAQEATHGV